MTLIMILYLFEYKEIKKNNEIKDEENNIKDLINNLFIDLQKKSKNDKHI